MPPEGTSAGGGSTGTAVGEGFEAVAAVGFQFEISKTAPSLEQIREILGACVYRGKGLEGSVDHELLEMCSFGELQKRVQFSHRELLAGLEELDAFSIGGRWRIVDSALMERTADDLLLLIIEQDMPLDKIDPKACVQALPSCESVVLGHCLRTYSYPTVDGERAKSEASTLITHLNGLRFLLPCAATPAYSIKFRLDLDKVARLRAHQILRAREVECDRDGRSLLLSDFMEEWAASMPDIDTPDRDLLKGIGLIEANGTDDENATVIYVPASGLPFPPVERLAALFRVKPKWPMSELESYISEADRKAGFLLKNTRVSTDPTTGLKLFSAR
ncbi:unnamed protein product [Ascophyllum nodosum]